MLPKGEAKKVTIYLNEDTRAHVEPLWSAILDFLRHKQVSGATLFRADAGFGAHEQFHNPQSEYISEHNGVRIEFIDTAQRVDNLLPTLYEMVTDGLITIQDLTVVKSVEKGITRQPATQGTQKTILNTAAKLVRIYIGESDKWNDELLYEAIVKKLRMLDFSGATVYRGILGYGATGHMRRTGRFQTSGDLPIMISVVEKPEKVNDLVSVVAEMMQDGIIVTSDVELHEITNEVPNSAGSGSA